MTMTLASIGALLVAVTVAASSAVQVNEPEHDPATRQADMCEMGICQEYTHYDIPLDDETQEYMADVCEEYGIDLRVMLAICWQESRFQPEVIGDNGQSFGLCQIKRKYHEERIARLEVTNLLVGCDFMAELLEMFGDYHSALTYYRYGTLTATGEPYADMVMERANSFEER